MRRQLPLALSLLAGLIVWAVVTWPLPPKFASAVPISDRASPGATRVIGTVPGDHLQLLYHFWLAGEALSGRIPPCSNPFEFNSSAGDPPRQFTTHYVPFSLVHSAVAPLCGRAAGWNAAGLFSVLLGVLGTFLLARRLCGSGWTALLVSAALAAFPYRWSTLAAGSPTGFAMGLVPWLAYGLDRLARDGSLSGSAIAGVALLMSFCSDLHTFYFSALAAPALLLASFALSGGGALRRSPARALAAAVPLAIFAAAALVLSRLASSGLDATAMAGGRTLRETLLFSPVLRGLFTTRMLDGATNSIYVGVFAASFVALALVRLAIVAPRDGDWRRMVSAAGILSIAAIGVVLLAAGAHGPLDGLPFRAARAFIPKYTMIRQPAKVFCLLPTIMAMVAAISLRGLRFRGLDLCCTLLAAATLAQQSAWFRVVVSSLDNPMDAYRAASVAADDAGIAAPKAVVIPIWPGDSHYASLYELGVMASRLRLVNGYSPSPPADYFEGVFKPLESLNQGRLDSSQLRLLKGTGVDFIIFHEDAFPDKVSPFPAGMSLNDLRSNPALEQIFQGGRASAFRITGDETLQGDGGQALSRSSLDYAVALAWGERQVARSLETASAPGRINLALRAPVVMRPGMRYMVLDRATGWHSIPMDDPMGGEYPIPGGVTAPALIVLSAGGQDIGDGAITPALMFHNGTSLADGTVFLDTGAVPDRHCAIEGPFEPIPAGRWRVTVSAAGAVANDAVLEVAAGIRGAASTLATAPFVQLPGGGEAASIDFDWGSADPPFAFRVMAWQRFPLSIGSVRLEPLADGR